MDTVAATQPSTEFAVTLHVWKPCVGVCVPSCFPPFMERPAMEQHQEYIYKSMNQ